ncbi:hypothetical protein QQP08_007212 [Theobroma cacao]|nr:hypothetical protein QQP08_007212 [Theobroma cacao]
MPKELELKKVGPCTWRDLIGLTGEIDEVEQRVCRTSNNSVSPMDGRNKNQSRLPAADASLLIFQDKLVTLFVLDS